MSVLVQNYGSFLLASTMSMNGLMHTERPVVRDYALRAFENMTYRSSDYTTNLLNTVPNTAKRNQSYTKECRTKQCNTQQSAACFDNC